jgi:hypothetical protein
MSLDSNSSGQRTSFSSKRSLGYIACAAAASTLAASVLPAVAQAYVIFGSNCRYDPANDDDGLGIGVKTGDSLYNAAQHTSAINAAAKWNEKVAPQFTLVTYNTSVQDVTLGWENLGANIGGRTYWQCGSGHWANDPDVRWGANATYYVSTQNRRTAIMIHELGHSYGVDHNSNSSCDGGVAGLMASDAVGKTNACGWTSPTSDDVKGANDAHNG